MSFFAKRGRVEIIKDLLNIIDKFKKVTLKLIYTEDGKIKVIRLKRYLGYLAEKKWIRKIKVTSLKPRYHYSITALGRRFLALLNEVFDELEGVELI